MSDTLQQFISQPLRQVRYYRSGADANIDLNWLGFHDVGQGVELVFAVGRFFVTWDNAADEGLSFNHGCMVDFLRTGIFDDVSAHTDWKEHIGQPLKAVHLIPYEATIDIGEKKVFIVTAEVDPDTLQIDGMLDNLVVFFNQEARNAFFAQYPDT